MRDKGKPFVILLADDDEDDRMLTCDALAESSESYETNCLCVTDGEELMDYLHRRGRYVPPSPTPRPDLILLDLNMPKKDGREALREMKSDAHLRQIPVVVLTTSNAPEDVFHSYDSGASAFIVKPATFDGLVDVMRGLGRYWFQIVELAREHELK